MCVSIIPLFNTVADPLIPFSLLRRTTSPHQLRTAPQSCDQSFSHKLNRTLQASVETKNPVRVIRGYKLTGEYAPSKGYRYDGLYSVEKAWLEKGVEGYMVCKYALRVRFVCFVLFVLLALPDYSSCFAVTHSLVHSTPPSCIIASFPTRPMMQRIPGQPPLPIATDGDEDDEDAQSGSSDADAGVKGENLDESEGEGEE